MAGLFFEHESQMGPSAMCPCIIARDESRPSAHETESKWVYQCPEHKAAGCMPDDIYKHHRSISTLEATVLANLPDGSFVSPAIVTFKGGKPEIVSIDTSTRVPKNPLLWLLNIHDGEICFRHPDANDAVSAAVSAALDANPKASLSLSTIATTAAVFAAHDDHVAALPNEKKHKLVNALGEHVTHTAPHLFWRRKSGKVSIVASRAIANA